MSESTKVKKTSPPPHHALVSRITLIDLLTAIFIPATIASVWPGLPPQGRAGVFAGLVILSLASMWWAASLAHTFQVNRPGRRVLLQLYSFLAMASFAVLAPAIIFVVIGLIFRLFFSSMGYSESSDLVLGMIVLLPTGLMTASIAGVEICRTRYAALQAPPAEPRKLPKVLRAPLPSPAPRAPAAAQESTPQPSRRKKKRKKKRSKLRRDRSSSEPRALPTPPPPF